MKTKATCQGQRTRKTKVAWDVVATVETPYSATQPTVDFFYVRERVPLSYLNPCCFRSLHWQPNVIQTDPTGYLVHCTHQISTRCPRADIYPYEKYWACSAHSSIMSKSILEAINFSLQVSGLHSDYIRVTWEAFENLMPRTTS